VPLLVLFCGIKGRILLITSTILPNQDPVIPQIRISLHAQPIFTVSSNIPLYLVALWDYCICKIAVLTSTSCQCYPIIKHFKQCMSINVVKYLFLIFCNGCHVRFHLFKFFLQYSDFILESGTFKILSTISNINISTFLPKLI